MKKLISSALAGLLALSTTASADEVGTTRLSFGASTMGAKIESSHRFHKNLALRGFVGGMVKLKPSVDIDGTTFSTDLTPTGAGLMLDWYPGRTGFRVSGGAAYLKTDFTGSATATAANPLTVGGTTLSGGETINATINSKNNSISPILSMGYDHNIGDNWVISGEVGAIFNGGYEAAVNVSGGIVPSATDLAAEAKTIEDTLNDFGVYPVISIMVGTRF